MKLFFCLLVICCMNAVYAADWPRWRGPQADARWNAAALPADYAARVPAQLWSVPVGQGYGGVTLQAGRVYVMDRQKEGTERERVLCYDAGSGKQVWLQELPATYGDMGGYATGPRASVTLHDGRAYTLGALGKVCCMDASTGAMIWQRDLATEQQAKMPQWGYAASPVMHDGRLLIHVGGVTALDPMTGKTLWHGGKDAAGYCTPELFQHGGQSWIAQWGPNHIEVLHAANGQLAWSHEYKITYGVSIAQPIIAGGMLVVSGYWHGAKGFTLGKSMAETQLQWEEEKKLCALMSTPLYKDGVAYVLDKGQGLSAFEIKTGKILWADGFKLTPKDKHPQLHMIWMKEAANTVAILNANGELIYAKLNAEGVEELARHQIIGKTWAHPAFSDNQIFARSDTELVAWKLW
jgi:outer membrane protein assembly factor BamB